MSALLYTHVIPNSSNTVHESNDDKKNDFKSQETSEDMNMTITGKLDPLITINNIPYTEPSEYEKEMLVGTLNPTELIFQEAQEAQDEEEKKEASEDLQAQELRTRYQFITMVKVLALVRANRKPLSNPSTFSSNDKLQIINLMDTIMKTMTLDEITEEFHEICKAKIFIEGADYSSMPLTKI